jgi:hypothetical protein
LPVFILPETFPRAPIDAFDHDRLFTTNREVGAVSVREASSL